MTKKTIGIVTEIFALLLGFMALIPNASAAFYIRAEIAQQEGRIFIHNITLIESDFPFKNPSLQAGYSVQIIPGGSKEKFDFAGEFVRETFQDGELRGTVVPIESSFVNLYFDYQPSFTEVELYDKQGNLIGRESIEDIHVFCGNEKCDGGESQETCLRDCARTKGYSFAYALWAVVILLFFFLLYYLRKGYKTNTFQKHGGAQ